MKRTATKNWNVNRVRNEHVIGANTYDQVCKYVSLDTESRPQDESSSKEPHRTILNAETAGQEGVLLQEFGPLTTVILHSHVYFHIVNWDDCSQLIYGNLKNVPNHQPDIYWLRNTSPKPQRVQRFRHFIELRTPSNARIIQRVQGSLSIWNTLGNPMGNPMGNAMGIPAL